MSRFDSELEAHERDRHGGIVASLLPLRTRPARGDGREGFLPPAEAAARMGVSEAELVAMVARGQLEARLVGGERLVRPAVVSVLAVREPAG